MSCKTKGKGKGKRWMIPLLLLTGCSAAPEACSADSLEAIVRICEATIATAPTQAEAEVEARACVVAVHAWHSRCGGGS